MLRRGNRGEGIEGGQFRGIPIGNGGTSTIEECGAGGSGGGGGFAEGGMVGGWDKRQRVGEGARPIVSGKSGNRYRGGNVVQGGERVYEFTLSRRWGGGRVTNRRRRRKWGGRGGYLALDALVASSYIRRCLCRLVFGGVPRGVLGNGTALSAVPLPSTLNL